MVSYLNKHYSVFAYLFMMLFVTYFHGYIFRMNKNNLYLILIISLAWVAPEQGLADTVGKSIVVAARSEAADAGIRMLRQGGNAFDAAAATALALGVVEPGSSGIGGGGFFLLYIAKEDRYVMIDARETSPELAGHGEIYRSQSGVDGPQSAAVPGLLAGIDHLIVHYGTLDRPVIAKPAIALASDGFKTGHRLQSMLQWRKEALSPTAQQIFLPGKVPDANTVIRQAQLAATLKRFARHGADDFYRGETAKRLVSDMKKHGGLIRMNDLQSYRAIERKPVSFEYQGNHFVTAPPPSSGGMVLAEIFGMLTADQLQTLDETDRTHLLIESMKRAYRDRNQYLGDTDFISIPDLLDPDRLKKLRASIHMDKATPSDQLGHYSEPIGDGVDTTHFSIMDADGNIVSATLSINYAFGSGYVSPSTGILLNDEMDDFATQPGKANAYGLVQGAANAVAPGKRMLSSMTPTIIRGKKRTLIVGTPGGSRIISMVLLTATDFISQNGDPAYWSWLPRFHHQFLPDTVQYEPHTFSDNTIAELKKRGHQLKEVHKYGNMQAIYWDPDKQQLWGLTDPRGEGKALMYSVSE